LSLLFADIGAGLGLTQHEICTSVLGIPAEIIFGIPTKEVIVFPFNINRLNPHVFPQRLELDRERWVTENMTFVQPFVGVLVMIAEVIGAATGIKSISLCQKEIQAPRRNLGYLLPPPVQVL
jgi:hypothetical protein